jgi:putative transposase
VTLRCNNREFLFSRPSFELYLQILQEARTRFPLLLYNYCLMTNHVHLFFEAGRDDTLSKAMHWVSTSFVRRFNRASGRNGHLWEGRYRSTIVEQETYFFRCMAYVDLNPVRARLAATPLEYAWSGHAALRAEDSGRLDLHPLYLAMGADAASRYRAYQGLLADEAQRQPVPLAREYFVGSTRFVRRMERRFGLDGIGARLRRRVLSPGILCIGPKHGGVYK